MTRRTLYCTRNFGCEDDDATHPQPLASSEPYAVVWTVDENGVLLIEQPNRMPKAETLKILVPMFVVPLFMAWVLWFLFLLWRSNTLRIQDAPSPQPETQKLEQSRQILLTELECQKTCTVVKESDILVLEDNVVTLVVDVELGNALVVDQTKQSAADGSDLLSTASDSNRTVSTRTEEDDSCLGFDMQREENSTQKSTTPVVDHQTATTTVDEDMGQDNIIDSSPESVLFLPCQRQVPSLCAICLELYQQGDAVVWSNNCIHAFHQDCLINWLCLKENSSHLPCPSCRQDFLEMPQIYQTQRF